MKKCVVIILSVVMLFAAIPMQADAAAVCGNCGSTNVIEQYGGCAVISGYTHPFTTLHGQPSGCTVNIWQKYNILRCNKCGYETRNYFDDPWEVHSNPTHK